MNITLDLVEVKDKEVLAKLLKTYQKELGNTETPNVYKYLDSYWEEKGRFPFFINVDNTLAGFILINDYYYITEGAKSIAEFFILPQYRKHGVGEEAARQVFNRFPGKWEVGQLSRNKDAQVFWRKVIKNFTNGDFKEVKLTNDRWHGPVQVFKI